MATLPNPYPAGPRFAHNTQRKDVNVTANMNGPSVAPVESYQLRRVTAISPEARHIARQFIGVRSSEYLVQRVLDAEDTIKTLVARIERLEAKSVPAHLSKVETRA